MSTPARPDIKSCPESDVETLESCDDPRVKGPILVCRRAVERYRALRYQVVSIHIFIQRSPCWEVDLDSLPPDPLELEELELLLEWVLE